MIDIGSLFVLLSLLILVGVFVSRPFLERRATTVSEEEQTVSALMAERDRLLDALQELDFDQSVGKIPPEDYPVHRSRLLQRGVDVLRRLDAYQDQLVSQGVAFQQAAALAELEAGDQELDRRPSMTPTIPDDEIEDLVIARRRELNGKAAGFCPHCGHPIQKSDQFCSKCGETVV